MAFTTRQAGDRPTERLRVEYQVEWADRIESHEVGMHVAVLTDLHARREDHLDRGLPWRFIDVDRNSFSSVLAGQRPTCTVRVPNHLGTNLETLKLELEFRTLGDFEPEAIARRVDELRPLVEARLGLADLLGQLLSRDGLEPELSEIWYNAERSSALASSPDAAEPSAGSAENEELSALLRIFAREIATQPRPADHTDIEAAIRSRIDGLDHTLTTQLNAILHAPEFQAVESAWRGLHYLVSRVDTEPAMTIKVVDAPMEDLETSIQQFAFEDTPLVKMLENETSDVSGQPTFGLLVGDYLFSHDAVSLGVLQYLARVAHSLRAPLLTGVHHSLFGLSEGYHELWTPPDLSRTFATTDYSAWHAFRVSEAARYVVLCLPRFLLRERYGADDTPVEGFRFEENLNGLENERYLWGNAAYALATRVTSAFTAYGWCMAIHGVEGGGLVESLPVHAFTTDEGELALRCATEVAISDRRQRELEMLGCTPLVHCQGTDYAAFFATPMLHKLSVDDSDETATARHLMNRLPFVLAISLFARGLQMTARDAPGTLDSTSLERTLNNWLVRHVLLDDNASERMKIRFPLREVRVGLEETDNPFVLQAQLDIRLHDQALEVGPLTMSTTVPLRRRT